MIDASLGKGKTMTETTAAKKAAAQKPPADPPAAPDPRDGEIAQLKAEIEALRAAAGVPVPAAEPEEPVTLSMKAMLAAINDGADDPETVAVLNKVFRNFGAQDPSFEMPRSWQRVQRRIGLDPDKPNQERLDGIATVDEVNRFAYKTGLNITK